MFSRLQALSPDLLFRSFIESSDPNHSKSSVRMAVLNYKLVPDLDFAPVTTQPNTTISGIEGFSIVCNSFTAQEAHFQLVGGQST